MASDERPPEYERKREYYRVVYPTQEQPELTFGGRAARVMDCSERGLRCRVAASSPVPLVGDRVAGTVRFFAGEEIDVAGRVVRAEDEVIALSLDSPGIPFRIMLREQRRLRERYLPLS